MSAFNYTAKRNLITTHSVDIAYDLEAGMSVLVPDYEEKTNPHVSLDGSTDTIFHRASETWQLTTVPLGDVTDGDFEQWKEMLTSIMSGETFTFDAYGTIAAADNIQSAIYTPKSYSAKRISNISQVSGGVWTVSFRLRIL